ncbi:hypothetical protein H2O77_09665 [Cobetia sp. 4B]|uniref:hypothetical protein n=1 Tax=Cobetia sp. 4B TaxID=2758724 RepID=UPI001C042CA6|nr:hypothetical protein [Cobetia sp. 4B]MBR9754441.1 hypothetical protein [Gammaproteobacteria bacterium]QWN35602.1 hypothetical protein H2O77_09665 [Cobetia sp. 4B]
MKYKMALVLTLSFASSEVFAFDKDDAASLVKKFTETTACEVGDRDEDKPLQFKTIQLKEGMDTVDGFGVQYAVFWTGDLGCYGGRGGNSPHVSIVERSGFGSADPVVKIDEYELPDALKNIAHVTDFYGNDFKEQFYIKGFKYNPDDHQINPTREVSYLVKVGYSGMKIID